jgi:hypothetical protein
MKLVNKFVALKCGNYESITRGMQGDSILFSIMALYCRNCVHVVYNVTS